MKHSQLKTRAKTHKNPNDISQNKKQRNLVNKLNLKCIRIKIRIYDFRNHSSINNIKQYKIWFKSVSVDEGTDVIKDTPKIRLHMRLSL